MDIQLRKLELNDIEMVRNWRNSDEVSKYMYTSPKITPEQQLEWFKKIENRTDCVYWIIEYDGKSVGLANLTGIDYNLYSCYWAFYIGDTSIRGAGIGSKVEYNVLGFVFEFMELHKLRCEVLITNPNVIKMHRGFGFNIEAYYTDHCYKEGKWVDVVGMAMLRQDWYDNKQRLYDKIYKR